MPDPRDIRGHVDLVREQIARAGGTEGVAGAGAASAVPAAAAVGAGAAGATTLAGAGAAVTAVEGEFGKALQWAQFAQLPDEARSAQEAFRLLLQDLEKAGVDPTTIRKLRLRGPAILRNKKFPKGILAGLGKARKGATQSLLLARANLRGLREADLNKAVNSTFTLFKKAGVDDATIGQLRKAVKAVGPAAFQRIPVAQVAAALDQRKPGLMSSLWGYVRKKPQAGALPAELSEAIRATGTAPSKGTLKALAKGGIRAGSKVGALGGLLRIGGALATGQQLYDLAIGKKGRAQDVAGLMEAAAGATGAPVSSIEALREMQGRQDALAQRRAVLFQKEPNLAQSVIRALAGARDTGPLTRTEMAIGNYQRTAPPDPKNIKTLLDRLLEEAG